MGLLKVIEEYQSSLEVFSESLDDLYKAILCVTDVNSRNEMLVAYGKLDLPRERLWDSFEELKECIDKCVTIK